MGVTCYWYASHFSVDNYNIGCCMGLHAFCYRVMHSATGSCSLIQGHASFFAKLNSIDEKLKQLDYEEKLMAIGENYVFCGY